MRIITYTTRIDTENRNILVKENAVNYTACQYLDSPEKVAKMMADVFLIHLAAEEYVYLICLNNKCKPIGIFEVGHGTVNSCLLHTREIMIRNVLCGAVGFIVIHNHPSGCTSLSEQDKDITKRLFDAGELIGIHLHDHIVIGRGDDGSYEYYSMKENGIIP